MRNGVSILKDHAAVLLVGIIRQPCIKTVKTDPRIEWPTKSPAIRSHDCLMFLQHTVTIFVDLWHLIGTNLDVGIQTPKVR